MATFYSTENSEEPRHTVTNVDSQWVRHGSTRHKCRHNPAQSRHRAKADPPSHRYGATRVQTGWNGGFQPQEDDHHPRSLRSVARRAALKNRVQA
jgi:hypothetical protein